MFYIYLVEKRSKHKPIRPIEIEPPKVEFDNLLFNSNDIEESLPVLPKAPETTEMVRLY